MSGAAGIKAGKAYVAMGVDDSGVDKGLAESKSKIDAWHKSLSATAKNLQIEKRGSGEGALERILKGGPSSLIDAGADILGVGAGALAIDVVGRALNAATQKALELRDAFKAGKVTAGEMASELLGQVPIYGQIWQAGRGIHELLTNEKYAIELINQEAKHTAELFDAQVSKAKLLRGIIQNIAAEESRRRSELAADAEDDPYSKRVIERTQQGRDTEASIKSKMQADIDAVRAESNKNLAAQQKLIEDARAQFKAKYSSFNVPNDAPESLPDENIANNKYGREFRGERDAIKRAVEYRNRLSQKAIDEEQKIRDAAAKDQVNSATHTANQIDAILIERRQKNLEDIKRAEQAASDAQSDALAKRFEVEGNMLAAELERSKHHYDEKIKAAQSAAERQALIEGKALEETKLRNKAAADAAEKVEKEKAEALKQAKKNEDEQKKREQSLTEAQANYNQAKDNTSVRGTFNPFAASRTFGADGGASPIVGELKKLVEIAEKNLRELKNLPAPGQTFDD